MPQAGAFISAVFPRQFARFTKAVLLRCNMWHIGVRKDSFRIAVCRLCAVMSAAVVWRCRLAALPAVSVAAFHAKSPVSDAHMMFHVCQSSALPDAPFQCRRGRVTWGQNMAKDCEDGVFRFWVHLSVNNIPCRMQEYNNFVASEKACSAALLIELRHAGASA